MTQMPGVVLYQRENRLQKGLVYGRSERLCLAVNGGARRISFYRNRFAASYSQAGSAVDSRVEFKDLKDIFVYLPRAFEIGLGAPFPNMWMASGRLVGNAGRLLAGMETFVIYLCELLAVIAMARAPREMALWLLSSVTVLGVTMLAVVVTNVGTLYRFRYTFWILLIVLGTKSLETVIASLQRRRAQLQTIESN